MKKALIMLLAVFFLGMAVPAGPAAVGSGVNVKIVESSQLQKAGKVSKKGKSTKKKDTKRRLKRLADLGIGNPKAYVKFGKDLSLNEMAQIIAAWIIEVWTATGQLPGTLTSNPPDWLMFNLNGTCVSGPCDRWS